MAKGRKKVSSKQSVGTKRQRELLASSVCRKHGIQAGTTVLLPGGKYKHKCDVCFLERKPQTLGAKVTSRDLYKLVIFGK
jgi:hypothetical protein